MATEKQYLFFKSLYDEENDRTKQLREQAKNYLSLTTLYSAFIIYVLSYVKLHTGWSKGIFIAAIAAMLVGFVSSLLASGIASFEVANDANGVVEQYGDEPMSDEEFFDNRIADFVVANEINSDVNDIKAVQLTVGGYAMMAGVFLHACYVALAVS